MHQIGVYPDGAKRFVASTSSSTLISLGSESICHVFGVTSLVSGRFLRFAPDWSCSDAAVLFDRNSGDYWVLSFLATTVVKLLRTHGALALADLERHLGVLLPETDLSADLLPTLQSLADNGLVQPGSGPVRLPYS